MRVQGGAWSGELWHGPAWRLGGIGIAGASHVSLRDPARAIGLGENESFEFSILESSHV
ncbi:hypothetical protein [Bradyrhizobium genomosp. I (2014)]|uniref:hypothetical protein n=1 Tax=Bradyrhizobium genomosp. I (2014) TaxID=2683269 RepID=UPI0012F945BC|nr:hypothetical protein [Bradyrhizobium sp. CCBAU 43298]